MTCSQRVGPGTTGWGIGDWPWPAYAAEVGLDGKRPGAVRKLDADGVGGVGWNHKLHGAKLHAGLERDRAGGKQMAGGIERAHL
jgi:hypothetical protein